MKKHVKEIKASNYIVPDDVLSDISIKLQDVQNMCGELEDYYFGEPVVDHFSKCYQFCTKALAQTDLARAKLDFYKNYISEE